MFQVGDYVEVDFTECYDVPTRLPAARLEGKVICGGFEHDRIGIQFFEYVGGHGCGGHGTRGYCWWVYGRYIKKTKSKNLFV